MTRLRIWATAFALLGGTLGLLGATLIAQAAPQAPPRDSLPQTVLFSRDIKPILSDKCFKCHGPGSQLGNLRFDLEDGAKKALTGGRFAIVPGDSAKSQIIQRVTSTNPVLRMPRSQAGAAAGDPLSDREVQLLTRWIDQGAKWQKHWSFEAPIRPIVPTVRARQWVRNPIDAFVLHRLEQEGLAPSPEADRATLLRRVTLDLAGIPPTPADLDAFLADKSPKAYEKVVDRLLQSPRYGENMAYLWLDAARYGDSNGYQTDGERFMWRWRDWVINAFNSNMPYDQFTVEQLAGDLLPNPTLDQRIATGFNRNHRMNSEGGIIPEEYAVEYVVDRVDTTGTVFLGLTAGCARCHSHKYDPLTQKDYYQLFAYFNNVPENGKGRRIGNSPPYITAPTPDQLPKLKELDAKLAAAEDAYAKLQAETARAQKEWEGTLVASASTSTPVTWAPARGLVAHYPLDGDIKPLVAMAPPTAKPATVTVQNGEAQFAPGQIGQAASFDGKSFIQGGDVVGFASYGYYDDPYTISAWIYPTAATGAIVTKVADVTEPNGHGLNLKDGKIQYNSVTKWVDEGIRVQTEKTLPLNQWAQLTLAYDGGRWAEGVKLYVNGERWKWEVIVDDANSRTGPRREPLRIGGGGGPENRFQGSIDDVRVYNRELSAAEALVLADATAVNAIAALAEDKRSPGQTDKIRDYFLEHAAPAAIQTAWHGLLAARAERARYYDSLPTVMVMQEMSTPRESHLLVRGAYDKPGEKVTPVLPAFLASDPAAYAPNRLGLAQWLVNPANPLMARVTVNRFWQKYFGTGIVKTSEDFGSQGEQPSHPELLDWLATEFVRTRWDVKALQKTIVMSATYQQVSKATPDSIENDPENRLLARGPSLRLPAQTVRDQALAIAGLLVEKIGGPSVMPYQPPGLWKEVISGAEDYVQSRGDDLYRRSLYTFWKRTVPPPTMANFDASSREAHVVRLSRTNTPLQALDLMNDVAYVEAARVFAQRTMREGGTTPEERIAYAFRVATARRPNAGESQILVKAFTDTLDHFKAKPDEALKFVSHGEYRRDEQLNVSELAAYTNITSLILNLSETITKD